MVDGVIPIKVHHCRHYQSGRLPNWKDYYFQERTSGVLTQIDQNDFNILEANSNQIIKEL